MKFLLFLYNIILIFLTPIAFIIGFIIAYIKKDTKNFKERFGLITLKPKTKSKTIWFHCASVGEVRSIKNIVEYIRNKYSDTSIIVSTMTNQGRNEAESFLKADEVFLIPIENSTSIAYIIKNLNVKILFIVDTEIWPNLINTAALHTNLIMLNGRISEKIYTRYYYLRFIFKPLLKKFTIILTKSKDDMKRFKKIIGEDKNLITVGNIKFQERKNIKNITPMTEFKYLNYVLAASTHHPEEEFILQAFETVQKNFDKLIIAPRHINRATKVVNIVKRFNMSSSLLSSYNPNSKVVIIDKFGLLERLYINANKIFIGGSIANIGGHNIFEALQFEKIIATGKNMYNFLEIYNDAINCNLVVSIENNNQLIDWLTKDTQYSNFQLFFDTLSHKNKDSINKIGNLIDRIITKKTD